MPKLLPRRSLLFHLVALQFACGDGSESLPPSGDHEGEISSLDGFVDIFETLVLEEPEGAHLAQPVLHWDPDGG